MAIAKEIKKQRNNLCLDVMKPSVDTTHDAIANNIIANIIIAKNYKPPSSRLLLAELNSITKVYANPIIPV